MVATEKRHRVTSVIEPNRVLFDGTEKEARAYLEANFPMSSSDGFSGREIHSAQLVSPDGVVERFHRDNGWGSYDKDSDETTYKNDDDDEPVDEPVQVETVPSSPVVGAPVFGSSVGE